MAHEFGDNGTDDAVTGRSESGRGVVGISDSDVGVFGESNGDKHSGVVGTSEFRGVHGTSKAGVGVAGTSEKHLGVFGKSVAAAGVRGDSDQHVGVYGETKADNHSGVAGRSNFRGVHGISERGVGVAGTSDTNVGVLGESKGDKHSGVVGTSEFRGVHGTSKAGVGVAGTSEKHLGVFGKSVAAAGVRGDSDQHIGVYGETKSRDHAGVHGKGPRRAGFFEGDVEVTGDIRLLGADLAEQFDVADGQPARPGSVMVLAGGNAVRVSDSPYDRRVAGVVSGAGDLRPGLVLDNRSSTDRREALALSGKVWVLVDADHAPVDVGDLLTTSPTPGHAMRADDPVQAFGAVIGKALDPLPTGRGQIRALVALQ